LGILAIPLLLIAPAEITTPEGALHRDGDPAQRVGGGWSEVLSLATDMGASIDNQVATRRESATVSR
jgi:hypothetical protein